ncbi:ABC transporter permease [Thermoflexus sp.]|uniref:ABC transporter permease n=1 Tax=Thermoflexus sp. TaxID=1969742 RepID=UPI0026130E1E|nr:ABC transporter permease [Thermoflexus sp.]MCX7691007.1 ABC transporter permease [Thermoflexus sp.]
MSLVEAFRTALSSLAANKMRSALTMLGVIIGVASVIALMSIGRGTQVAIRSQIERIGTNLIFVTPGAVRVGGVAQAPGSSSTLTYEDAQALKDLPGVAAVAPIFQTGAQIVYQRNNLRIQVYGVTPEFFIVRNLQVASGDSLSQAQVETGMAVTVLGANVAAQLFPEGDPVGQFVRLNNIPFRVVGVLAPVGGTGFGSLDNQVFVPLSAATQRLARGGQFRGSAVVSQIMVQADRAAQISTVMETIRAALRERHRLLDGDDDDFNLISQQDLIQTSTQITGTLTLFLGAIAAISLIVGGIGIMNIMLVSVPERPGEIGLRKAVGARRWDILMQFLSEAVTLSGLGGLIGVGIGIGASRLISGISVGTGTLRPVVQGDVIALALLFAVAVGVFFGIYPAIRAAALNPIEALRYE